MTLKQNKTEIVLGVWSPEKHIHLLMFILGSLWYTISADNALTGMINSERRLNIDVKIRVEFDIWVDWIVCMGLYWWSSGVMNWPDGCVGRRRAESGQFSGPLWPRCAAAASLGWVRWTGPWPRHCPAFNTPLPPAAALTADISRCCVTAHYGGGLHKTHDSFVKQLAAYFFITLLTWRQQLARLINLGIAIGQ